MRRLDVDALDGLLDGEPTGAFPVTVPLPPVAEAPVASGREDRLVRRMALAAAAGFVVAGALAGAGAGWSAGRRAEARAATQEATGGERLDAGVGGAAVGPTERAERAERAEPAVALVAVAEPAGSLAASGVVPGGALAVTADPAGSRVATGVAPTASPAAKSATEPAASLASPSAGPPIVARPTPADGGPDRWVVRFGFGAAGPEAGWEATVAEAARCAGRIEVIGYTCDAGDPAFNQDLSERRARAVASALAAAGVPEARLRARGGGPLDAADSPRRADRRRVELRCVPTT